MQTAHGIASEEHSLLSSRLRDALQDHSQRVMTMTFAFHFSHMMSTRIAPLSQRTIVAALVCGIFAIGSTAARADAQGTGTARGTLQGASVTKSVAVLTSSALAIQRFRTGLQVSGTSQLPTSGPTPLVTEALTWQAYPNASGYQIIREATFGAQHRLAGSAMIATLGPTTSFTAQGTPPFGTGTGGLSDPFGVKFRVVALVNGNPADTTAEVDGPVPFYAGEADYTRVAHTWPPPATAPFASVGWVHCQTTGTNGVFAWTRNPAATSYTLQLAPESGNAPAPQSTTNTTVTASLGTGVTRAYVRPEFEVKNWESAGYTSTVHGMWLYLGAAHTPAPTSSLAPCSQN